MTDAQAALAQVREALADEALFDDGASACDTLLAVRHFERVCALDNMTAILAHVEAQAAEIERLRAALTLVMDYPEVRKYLGSRVSDVADAALKEQR